MVNIDAYDADCYEVDCIGVDDNIVLHGYGVYIGNDVYMHV